MGYLNQTVLIVDDEAELRDIFAISMEAKGYNVRQAQNGKEALKIIQNESIDLVISDVRMPNGSGTELLEAIHQMPPPKPKIIMVTGYSELTQEKCAALGAIALLEKPCNLGGLTKLVKQQLEEN